MVEQQSKRVDARVILGRRGGEAQWNVRGGDGGGGGRGGGGGGSAHTCRASSRNP